MITRYGCRHVKKDFLFLMSGIVAQWDGLPRPYYSRSGPWGQHYRGQYLSRSRIPHYTLKIFNERFFKELREHLGVNTCDQRSRKTILSSEYPSFDFHEPFDEEDTLWVPDIREKEPEMLLRLTTAFKKIFDREWDKSLCECYSEDLCVGFAEDIKDISITAHSGAIRAMCTVLGHPNVVLPTGGPCTELLPSSDQWQIFAWYLQRFSLWSSK